jgi:hypothetical protein
MNCFVECGVPQWNKGHHINHSNAWVHTCMFMNIEKVNGTCGKVSGGMCAVQGKYAAVMVGVGMNVEQIGGYHCAHIGQCFGALALADIDDALEHRVIFISSPSWAVVG